MDALTFNEKVAWEARRVAAAFLVETFGIVTLEGPFVIVEEEGESRKREVIIFEGVSGDVPISWAVDKERGALVSVEVGSKENSCGLYTLDSLSEPHSEYLFHGTHETFNERMAHGLFRLGCENEAIFETLNVSFNHHEQLELRLSMPREFWPKTWLDEPRHS